MDYGRIIAQSVSTGSIRREERGRGNEAARVPLDGECKYLGMQYARSSHAPLPLLFPSDELGSQRVAVAVQAQVQVDICSTSVKQVCSIWSIVGAFTV